MFETLRNHLFRSQLVLEIFVYGTFRVILKAIRVKIIDLFNFSRLITGNYAPNKSVSRRLFGILLIEISTE